MSLQEIQQLQGEARVCKSCDILGTDQPHTASVGMHQDVRDLPNDTQRWISNLAGGIHNKNWTC